MEGKPMRIATRTFGLALAVLAMMAGGAQAGPTKGRPVQTGQTTSYGTGSDGDLQNGLSPMFNDLGNGVIKDQRTGLFWEKKSDDGSIHDQDNVYTWGQAVSPYSMNGTMVTTFLAELNTPPCFADFCDWRIPNVRELAMLANFGAFHPATFAAFNTACTAGCTVTACSCTHSGYHWSSSSVQTFPSHAWFVNLEYGGVTANDKTTNEYVRDLTLWSFDRLTF